MKHILIILFMAWASLLAGQTRQDSVTVTPMASVPSVAVDGESVFAMQSILNGKSKWTKFDVDALTAYLKAIIPLTEVEVDSFVANNGYVTSESDPIYAADSSQLKADIAALFVDSTRLIQDSILVYFQSGIEVGRDTIAGTGGGGGGGIGTESDPIYAADSAQLKADIAALFVDSTRLLQDSILVYFQDGIEVGRDTLSLSTPDFFTGSASDTLSITATSNSVLYINDTLQYIYSGTSWKPLRKGQTIYNTVDSSFTVLTEYLDDLVTEVVPDSLNYAILSGYIDSLNRGIIAKPAGKNLFNPAIITEGKYIGSDGAFLSNSSYSISDYIRVGDDTTYQYSGGVVATGPFRVNFYTGNYTFISAVERDGSGVVIPPSGARFAKITIENANINTAQFQVSPTSSYEPYTPTNLLDLIENNADSVQILQVAIDSFKRGSGKNLLNPNEYVSAYISASTGDILPTSSYITSGFVPVEPYRYYYLSNLAKSGPFGINLYDKHKNLVETVAGAANQYAVPDGVHYMRVSMETVDTSSAQIEQGTEGTFFEQFEQLYSDQDLPDALQVKGEIILPKYSYFVKNNDYVVYFDNIIEKQLEETADTKFSHGYNYNRLNLFSPGGPYNNISYTIKTYQNQSKIDQTLRYYHSVESTANAGDTTKILHIGDSFTDIATYVSENKSILTNDGVVVSLIGTCRRDTNTIQESWSGGAIKNYILTNHGDARTLTVSGVTAIPDAGFSGTLYNDSNGKEWKTIGVSISGGVGKIRLTPSDGSLSPDIPSSGNILKVSGDGEDTIAYSSVTNTYNNPFWNHNTNELDFSYYLNFWNQETPDIIVVQFTLNDLSGYGYIGPDDLDSEFQNMKTMIDSLHSHIPSADIIFSIEPPGAKNMRVRDINVRHHNHLKYADKIFRFFEDNADYNFLRIVPSYAYVDLDYGYNLSTAYPSPRLSAVGEVYATDEIHPSSDGMKQISDIITGCIHYILASRIP